MVAIDSAVRALCPVCGEEGDAADADLWRGCPRCAGAGRTVAFTLSLPNAGFRENIKAACERPVTATTGLWHWQHSLPFRGRGLISLGEANTPVIALSKTDDSLILLKCEWANPTWSHKDRLACSVIAAALAVGADTVVVASSGNHGASVAAYAAAADIECVVFTAGAIPPALTAMIASFGASVVRSESAHERHEQLTRRLADTGVFPASNASWPPVGAHPLGVVGYRTVAWELLSQFGADQLPEWVVCPTASGDLVAGVAAGFQDLVQAGLIEKTPRMVVAERFGAVREYLRTGRSGPVRLEATQAFSIASAYATEQAAYAVTSSKGTALTVTEAQVLATRAQLGRRYGLFLEGASAVGVAAAHSLLESGPARRGDRILVMGTSSGLKAVAT